MLDKGTIIHQNSFLGDLRFSDREEKKGCPQAELPVHSTPLAGEGETCGLASCDLEENEAPARTQVWCPSTKIRSGFAWIALSRTPSRLFNHPPQSFGLGRASKGAYVFARIVVASRLNISRRYETTESSQADLYQPPLERGTVHKPPPQRRGVLDSCSRYVTSI